VTGTWAVIPVKPLEQAKSRLLTDLQAAECALLSQAMFRDVLHALEAARGIDGITVLTHDDTVARLTLQMGHVVIPDENAELNLGLDAAAHRIAGLGADRMLVIPADIPTITSKDIEQLLREHTSGLGLCPAIRDGGTNALLVSPPDAIEFHFGADSARRHLDAAQQRGINSSHLLIPAFSHDIDTADDLVRLSQQQVDCHTVHYLRSSGIFARLGLKPARISA